MMSNSEVDPNKTSHLSKGAQQLKIVRELPQLTSSVRKKRQ